MKEVSSIQALILTPEELAELQGAVRKALPAEQAEIICACLEIPAWVAELLQEKNMTIAKLRKLVFGARTESSRNLGGKSPKGNPKCVKPKKSRKGKGHGRLGMDEYPGARRVEVKHSELRACLEIGRGPAARDFGGGQSGEAGASPQRAVTAEPTQAAAKRSAARRVFAEKARGLRCSSVTRDLAAMLPSRASPSGLFRENRTPPNFQTRSQRRRSLSQVQQRQSERPRQAGQDHRTWTIMRTKER